MACLIAEHVGTMDRESDHEALEDSFAAFGAQGDPLRPPVIGSPSPAYPGKQRLAICHAGSAYGYGLEPD